MYMPNIVQVIPHKNYTVDVYFDDGKITCYDMSQNIKKGVFQVLQKLELFMERCTIMNDTLAWDIEGNRDAAKCLDIDPDTLYELPHVAR